MCFLSRSSSIAEETITDCCKNFQMRLIREMIIYNVNWCINTIMSNCLRKMFKTNVSKWVENNSERYISKTRFTSLC